MRRLWIISSYVLPEIIDTNTVDPWDMRSFREVWLGRKSQEGDSNLDKADLDLLTKEKGKIKKMWPAQTAVQLSVPMIPLLLHLRALNCGMWWCFCASDDSCVPRTRQSGMQLLASRLPPVVPVCLCCQRLRRRTTTGPGQRAGQHDSSTTLLVSNFKQRLFDIFNCWSPQHMLLGSSER